MQAFIGLKGSAGGLMSMNELLTGSVLRNHLLFVTIIIQATNKRNIFKVLVCLSTNKLGVQQPALYSVLPKYFTSVHLY